MDDAWEECGKESPGGREGSETVPSCADGEHIVNVDRVRKDWK